LVHGASKQSSGGAVAASPVNSAMGQQQQPQGNSGGGEVRIQQQGSETPSSVPSATANANETDSSQVSTAPPGTAITTGPAAGSTEPMDTSSSSSDGGAQQMGQAQQTNGNLKLFYNSKLNSF
jgi:hypothetical protein